MALNLSSPSASIALLAGFSISLLIALAFAYRCGASANDFRVLLAGTFSSFSGALLLALKGITNDHNPPPPPPAVPGV
jgi:hypothetical protein